MAFPSTIRLLLHVPWQSMAGVDCPGHASLIKTIIGGANIIDMMFLVINAKEMVQTQTAECMVIGELLIDKLIVCLNKVDLILKKERKAQVKLKKKALK